jgi:hypothetical protein
VTLHADSGGDASDAWAAVRWICQAVVQIVDAVVRIATDENPRPMRRLCIMGTWVVTIIVLVIVAKVMPPVPPLPWW